jgi:hypothetical protein
MARYIGLSESDAARFFQPFLRIGAYRDYKSLIACHGRAREKLMLYLGKLAEVGLYDLVLRPHPRETPDFYLRTMADWSPQMRERVTVDSSSGISELIMNCDLEISCETCTTALEAWIVGKPTVELVFERHPTFFHEEPSALNVLCDKPEDLLRIVSAALEHPDQLGFRAGRQQHLEKWCYSADGKSSERIAEVIASAVHAKEKPSCDYTINERRKGMKLLALRKMNLPYSFDPLLWLKAGIAPKSYSTKKFVYSKTIRPSDVVEARLMLDKMSNLAGL